MSGGGGSSDVTVGYKYYLGIHMVLCHGPIDNVSKIMVDDKTAWSGTAIGGAITVSADSLFGGEEREGGVSGTIDILMGESTQAKNSYLQSMLGTTIPAFRGVVSAVLNQVYVGLNPYLKPWSFRAQRIHKTTGGSTQWYDAKAQIGSDMNPAHIIRECLTDSLWGLGYGVSDIDDASFTAAADRLHTEGMGVSILWDKSISINDFIGVILSHIQGSLYISRTSGKFILKLSRADFVTSNLITLDESSISKIVNFKRASIGELVNSVTVIYWDATTGKEGSVTVQDIALIAQQGCVVSTTKQYQGFTTGYNATRAASTELQALSTPLASATIYANRKASNLNVGDVFILSWPRYGVTQLVCRVTMIEFGTLDNNTVKIEAVEDVFSVAAAVYAPPPVTNWTDPVTTPSACTYQFIFDSPYWDIAQKIGDTQAQQLASTASFAQAVGVRPSSDSIYARMYTKSSGSYAESNKLDFCPTAKLAQSIGYLTTTVSVDSWVDRDIIKPGSYAIIDNEIVAVDAVSAGSITIRRGCLDTVPATHVVNARIYFADDFAATDGFEYASGDVARFKLLPVTGKGTYALASATELTSTMVARQAKPYPPGNFKINGSAYPSTVTGDISATWSHRDRLMQTVKPIVDTTSSSIGPEAGVTYSISLLRASDSAVLASATGISGESYVLPYYGTLDVKLELQSVRSGINSFQKHSHAFYLDNPVRTITLLHFNGSDSSTTFTDSVSPGKTFTAVGNARLTTTNPKFGTACLTLDGTGDWIQTPGSIDFVLGAGDFTIEAFINTTDSNFALVDFYGSNGWQVSVTSAGKLSFYAGTNQVATGVTSVNTGLWVHIAVTRQGATLKLWVNGVQDASVTNSTNMNTQNAYLALGAQVSNRNAAYDMSGLIDEFRLRKGQAIYTTAFTPPSSELAVL